MKIEKIIKCFNSDYILRKKIIPNATIHAYKDVEYNVFSIKDCKSNLLFTYKQTVKLTSESDAERLDIEFLTDFINNLWKLK